MLQVVAIFSFGFCFRRTFEELSKKISPLESRLENSKKWKKSEVKNFSFHGCLNPSAVQIYVPSYRLYLNVKSFFGDAVGAFLFSPLNRLP